MRNGTQSATWSAVALAAAPVIPVLAIPDLGIHARVTPVLAIPDLGIQAREAVRRDVTAAIDVRREMVTPDPPAATPDEPVVSPDRRLDRSRRRCDVQR